MVFTKLLLENSLAIRPCNWEAASEPLLPKVARCIPILPSRNIGKCAARVLKRFDATFSSYTLCTAGSKTAICATDIFNRALRLLFYLHMTYYVKITRSISKGGLFTKIDQFFNEHYVLHLRNTVSPC